MNSARTTGTVESHGRILNRLEDPVLLIDERRTVLYGNAAAERVLLAKTGLEMRLGRLVAETPAGNARLAQLIADCERSSHVKGSSSRGLRLSRASATGHWLALISPLHPLQDTTDRERIFVVHLVRRIHPRHLPTVALRDLFGLTHKEVDVIAGLLRRESLQDVAKRMNLSHETIRAYVKRILRKCDVRSQVGLISLLQRISLLAGRD